MSTPTQPALVSYHFTSPTSHPFENIEWEVRDAEVGSFKQAGVEFPTTWSQNATNIVAQKYFRGQRNSPERETSVRQIVGRVADTITEWSFLSGLFEDTDRDNEAHALNHELTHILVNQFAAFNSPVWFNVGFEEHPQCSACFILSVDDTLDDILAWNTKEGKIFQGGSGSGVSLSKLRGSMEELSKGGLASGPVSFMRGADGWAGTISSGGKTRRAAKMVVLDIDHPDIRHFITCKADEEDDLAALRAAGRIKSFNDSLRFGHYQNANNSVRVSDDFMRKVVGEDPDPEWPLLARGHHSGKNAGTPIVLENAHDLWDTIAKAAWRCADPGIQFDTTINNWHTSPATGRINASNPCSEYMHLDNSACNLASINLLKFRQKDGSFAVENFRRAVDTLITSMDVLVDSSSYPTPEIEKNAKDYRQLGLGYANLGAYLMAAGYPYDSQEGRDLAAAITSLMGAEAYLQSTRLASRLGSYAGYTLPDKSPEGETNAQAHCRVMIQHAKAAEYLAHAINVRPVDESIPFIVRDAQVIAEAAANIWIEAIKEGNEYGYRNAQVTVLAPTGTISFLMDCDTTGIEPDFSLVKYKELVGGGSAKIVNQTVQMALQNLDYSARSIRSILEEIQNGAGAADLVSSGLLDEEHEAIFHTANDISPAGHIKMMGAVQPFLSGAISKTVNMPNSATPQDVANAYLLAWQEGVKALAIYRDGCKGAQPLSSKKVEADANTPSAPPAQGRVRLPSTRSAVTHKFSVAGTEGYITAGLYPDGKPGEVFLIGFGKDGSTLQGVMSAFATQLSISLQWGVPLDEFVLKHAGTKFEPHGITGNPEIPFATSPIDYIAKWLASQFCEPVTQAQLGLRTESALVLNEDRAAIKAEHQPPNVQLALQSDSLCPECGGIMRRTGSCETCSSCGLNTGCG
jgi:ribonucleoside-diphosphate reductase alpha chain